MTLARAADRTSRIGLGTAVVIPDYRHLMTTAAAVATLAGQAPGRVAVGLGPGRAQIMHGGKPGLWKDLDAYTIALRALLRGEEVQWNGTPHRLLHPAGVVAARPIDVPILLSAEGPKGLEIAQSVADGVISFGQAKAGFAWNAVLLHGTVLPDGPVDEDYLLAAAGAGAGAAYHITYAGGGEAVDRLPNGAQYRASIERHPVEQRAFAMWGKHLIDATPEERAALTPQTVREMTFTGTAEELQGRLQEMEKARRHRGHLSARRAPTSTGSSSRSRRWPAPARDRPRRRLPVRYLQACPLPTSALTFGMISSARRLRSSSVLAVGTSRNGGHRSGIVIPASL